MEWPKVTTAGEKHKRAYIVPGKAVKGLRGFLNVSNILGDPDLDLRERIRKKRKRSTHAASTKKSKAS